jgi:hypothetical protein
MSKSIAALCALAWLVAAGDAVAACSGNVLFEDAFDDDLTNWAEDVDHEQIEGGQYKVTPDLDSSWSRLPATLHFDRQRMCIEISVEGATENTFDAGAIFWATDYNNYYLAQIGRSESGEPLVGIHNRVDGEWLSVYSERSTAFEVGNGVANTVTVDIDGSIVSVAVNDTEITKFRAVKQDGRRRIGLYAQVDEQGGTAAFNYLKVTSP